MDRPEVISSNTKGDDTNAREPILTTVFFLFAGASVVIGLICLVELPDGFRVPAFLWALVQAAGFVWMGRILMYLDDLVNTLSFLKQKE